MDVIERTEEVVKDVYGLAKPRLRGMVHAWSVFPALTAGLILTFTCDPGTERLSVFIYTLSITAMLGASAAYHRLKVSPRTNVWLRRIDHGMIGVAVAGTYTPVVALVSEGTTRTALLTMLWLGALGSLALVFAWPSAPRVLRSGLYVFLGWAGIVVIPDIINKAGIVALAFVGLGGLLYSIGALVYAKRAPNPRPGFFGFHEVFHSFVVAAVVAHFIAVAIVASQFS